ncbi:MAG: thioredoxin [bacterium]|nr:thioredoxin [bacterium]
MDSIYHCPSCGAKNRVAQDKAGLKPKCGKCGVSLAGAAQAGRVNTLTDSDFAGRIQQAGAPVLVDFYSPTCGPCQMLAPVLESLAARFSGKLIIYKINTASEQANAARFGIRGVPTLIFFRQGQEADRIVGAMPEEDLTRRIQAFLG